MPPKLAPLVNSTHLTEIAIPMAVLLAIPVTYVLAVLQTSVCPLVPGGAAPDLLILEATLIVLWTQQPSRIAGAGAIGLIHDLLGPGRLGGGVFACLVWGLLLSRLQQKVFTENAIAESLLAAVGTALVLGLIVLFHNSLGGVAWSAGHFEAVVRCAMFTGAAAIPVTLCRSRFRRRAALAV